MAVAAPAGPPPFTAMSTCSIGPFSRLARLFPQSGARRHPLLDQRNPLVRAVRGVVVHVVVAPSLVEAHRPRVRRHDVHLGADDGTAGLLGPLLEPLVERVGGPDP